MPGQAREGGPGGGHYVKLRGMPPKVTTREVTQFFGWAKVEPVPGGMVFDIDGGRKSGTAFAELASRADVDRCVEQLDQQCIDTSERSDRYVSVAATTGADYQAALRAAAEDRYVAVRGMDYKARPADVREFFALAEVDVDLRDVVLPAGDDGRRSGDALVRVRSQGDVERSVEELDEKSVGGSPRFVRVSRCARSEYDEARRAAPRRGLGDSDPISVRCKERQLARRTRDFDRADALRAELEADGVKIDDDACRWTAGDGRSGCWGPATPAGAGAGAPAELTAEQQRQLDAWQQAKRERDFDTADAIRDRLRAEGVDTALHRPAGHRGRDLSRGPPRREDLPAVTPEQAQALDDWVAAKRERDYTKADALRERLAGEGVATEDHRPPRLRPGSCGPPRERGTATTDEEERQLNEWVRARRAGDRDAADELRQQLLRACIDPAEHRPPPGRGRSGSRGPAGRARDGSRGPPPPRPPPVSDARRSELEAEVNGLRESSFRDSTQFPCSLNGLERKFVHEAAERAGLQSQSIGVGAERRVYVMKAPPAGAAGARAGAPRAPPESAAELRGRRPAELRRLCAERGADADAAEEWSKEECVAWLAARPARGAGAARTAGAGEPDISMSAVELTDESRALLVEKFRPHVPDGWTLRCERLKLCMGPLSRAVNRRDPRDCADARAGEVRALEPGDEVSFRIVAVGRDEENTIITAGVVGAPSTFRTPQITVAHHPDERPAEREFTWVPMPQSDMLKLTGHVREYEREPDPATDEPPPPATERGVLVRWVEDRKFGFIEPAISGRVGEVHQPGGRDRAAADADENGAGEEEGAEADDSGDVFVHAAAFASGKVPGEGAQVRYALQRDRHGRLKAINVQEP